jgi:hypothetical protein
MDGYQLVFFFTFSVLLYHTSCQPPDDRLNDKTTHSRRKRYVVFPAGSTYSVSDLLSIFSNTLNSSEISLFKKFELYLPCITVNTVFKNSGKDRCGGRNRK